jgi:hypothetical protein
MWAYAAVPVVHGEVGQFVNQHGAQQSSRPYPEVATQGDAASLTVGCCEPLAISGVNG